MPKVPPSHTKRTQRRAEGVYSQTHTRKISTAEQQRLSKKEIYEVASENLTDAIAQRIGAELEYYNSATSEDKKKELNLLIRQYQNQERNLRVALFDAKRYNKPYVENTPLSQSLTDLFISLFGAPIINKIREISPDFKMRDLAELINATSQCTGTIGRARNGASAASAAASGSSASGSSASSSACAPGSIIDTSICWICGLPLDRKKYGTEECEHVLPVAQATYYLALYGPHIKKIKAAIRAKKATDADRKLLKLLDKIYLLEYRWAHSGCNQIKNDYCAIVAKLDSSKIHMIAEVHEQSLKKFLREIYSINTHAKMTGTQLREDIQAAYKTENNFITARFREMSCVYQDICNFLNTTNSNNTNSQKSLNTLTIIGGARLLYEKGRLSDETKKQIYSFTTDIQISKTSYNFIYFLSILNKLFIDRFINFNNSLFLSAYITKEQKDIATGGIIDEFPLDIRYIYIKLFKINMISNDTKYLRSFGQKYYVFMKDLLHIAYLYLLTIKKVEILNYELPDIVAFMNKLALFLVELIMNERYKLPEIKAAYFNQQKTNGIYMPIYKLLLSVFSEHTTKADPAELFKGYRDSLKGHDIYKYIKDLLNDRYKYDIDVFEEEYADEDVLASIKDSFNQTQKETELDAEKLSANFIETKPIEKAALMDAINAATAAAPNIQDPIIKAGAKVEKKIDDEAKNAVSAAAETAITSAVEKSTEPIIIDNNHINHVNRTAAEEKEAAEMLLLFAQRTITELNKPTTILTHNLSTPPFDYLASSVSAPEMPGHPADSAMKKKDDCDNYTLKLDQIDKEIKQIIQTVGTDILYNVGTGKHIIKYNIKPIKQNFLTLQKEYNTIKSDCDKITAGAYYEPWPFDHVEYVEEVNNNLGGGAKKIHYKKRTVKHCPKRYIKTRKHRKARK